MVWEIFFIENFFKLACCSCLLRKGMAGRGEHRHYDSILKGEVQSRTRQEKSLLDRGQDWTYNDCPLTGKAKCFPLGILPYLWERESRINTSFKKKLLLCINCTEWWVPQWHFHSSMPCVLTMFPCPDPCSPPPPPPTSLLLLPSSLHVKASTRP